ncbi:hypothetical protein K3495_g15791, partial [Podosphaera aphanis]
MPALVPNPASYQCSSTPPETVKDADGDTRMTGAPASDAVIEGTSRLIVSNYLPSARRLRIGGVKRLAPGQSRVQGLESGVSKAVAMSQTAEDREATRDMNGNSFIIDVLINDLYTVPTLIDSGCDCLAAVSNSLVRKANLPRIRVTPRKLTEATSSNHSGEVIKEMTKMELDIDGYQKTLYAYIIPKLSHGLILGKPWMERENVVYHARDRYIEIREATVGGLPLRVWEKQKNLLKLTPNILSLSAGVFLATVRRARKKNNEMSQVFSVTLADIQKALAPDKKSSISLEKLPSRYKKFANLFKKELIDKLPPHRPGSDHEIKLESNKEIPWGPLYGMSRDELLVLRKTLTDLLDKG